MSPLPQQLPLFGRRLGLLIRAVLAIVNRLPRLPRLSPLKLALKQSLLLLSQSLPLLPLPQACPLPLPQVAALQVKLSALKTLTSMVSSADAKSDTPIFMESVRLSIREPPQLTPPTLRPQAPHPLVVLPRALAVAQPPPQAPPPPLNL